MKCQQRGKENLENIDNLENCNYELQAAEDQVQISVSAVMSMFAAIFACLMIYPGSVLWADSIILSLLLFVAAIVMGFIGLISTSHSGGSIVGSGYAKIGICIPCIVFFLAVLLPILLVNVHPHQRMTCGTNLSGLGKAMLVYASDYDDELPRAGGRKNRWGPNLPMWNSSTPSHPASVTVSASLYLLVKYAKASKPRNRSDSVLIQETIMGGG